jgi:hypothetical protein
VFVNKLLDKLHEDLVKELQAERRPKTDDQSRSGAQGFAEGEPLQSGHNLVVSYQTVTEASISLSIQV